jgi:predicted nucleic acid-binding protein
VRRILVDLNVLLDVLLERRQFAAPAVALWALVERRRVEGWMPAHGVTTIFYLVAKARDRETARSVVGDLLSVFRVAPIDEAILRRAATLDLAYFEDAVSAACAEAVGCEAIVTRDSDGFARSPVPAIEPLVALATIDAEGRLEPGDEGDEVHESRVAYGRAVESPSISRARRT